MTLDKQRIAIAEWCGWKPNPLLKDMAGNVWPQQPPDYLSDLNAMHEAEKMLQGEREWEAYIQNLLKLTRGKGFVVLHATAAQRAEAFLKAIKKWEDS